MPTWLKVVLVVVVLLGAAVGGAYWWWQQNAEAMIADAKATMADATRFAAGKDSAACVNEAAVRAKGSGFTGAIKDRLFLTGCLRAAKRTPGFCDGVPAATEILTSASWQQQLNQKYGLTPPFETVVIPAGIQDFCGRQSSAQPAR
jgi:hypothetical protein